MMAGLFSKIFKTVDVNKLADKADDWLFTSEEKSKAYFKWMDITSNEGYNLARRYIAMYWITITGLMALITFIGVFLDYGNTIAAKSFLVDMMKEPTTVITIFYFGGGIVSNFRKKE